MKIAYRRVLGRYVGEPFELLTRRIRTVIENTRTSVKKLPNSSILRNNSELDSTMVNKGRIHGELRYFLSFF